MLIGAVILGVIAAVAVTRVGHGALDELEREHEGSQW